MRACENLVINLSKFLLPITVKEKAIARQNQPIVAVMMGKADSLTWVINKIPRTNLTAAERICNFTLSKPTNTLVNAASG